MFDYKFNKKTYISKQMNKSLLILGKEIDRKRIKQMENDRMIIEECVRREYGALVAGGWKSRYNSWIYEKGPWHLALSIF